MDQYLLLGLSFVGIDVPVFPFHVLSDTRCQGFSPGTLVSSPLLLVNGSANEIKAKINVM